VTAKDLAKNVSESTSIVIEVDTTVANPVVHSLDRLTGSISDGAANINGLVTTNDSTPTITGLAETGSEVTITDAAGHLLGTAMAKGTVVNGQSTFTFELNSPLAEGTHTFRFITEDRAGNVSAPTSMVIGVNSSTDTPTMSMAETVRGQKLLCCKTHNKALSEKKDTTVVNNKAAALMVPWPWRW
jgi:hypothetical protein